MPKYNSLTPEEAAVIVDKHTEPSFVNEYDQLFAPGIFICRRCNAKLFDAKAKFDSGCGWPSFDAAFPDAETPDADGSRTEITCTNCGGHLGHVFKGERMTPKDTRHCVNSLSIKFVPAKD